MSEDQDDSFNASKAEIFEALSHPTRINILHILSERTLPFSELKRAAGLESNGLLTFHLGKLRDLVKLNSEGAYALTDEGREALRIVEASRNQPQAPRVQGPVFYLPHQKAILAGLLVALIVLGSVAIYQQTQLQSPTATHQGGASSPDVLVYGTAATNQSWQSGIQGSYQVIQISFTSAEGQTYYSYPNSAGQYWISLPPNQTYLLSVSYQGKGECAQSCASVDNFSQPVTVSLSNATLAKVTGQTTTENCSPWSCALTATVAFREQGDSISATGTCGAFLKLAPGNSTVNYNPSC